MKKHYSLFLTVLLSISQTLFSQNALDRIGLSISDPASVAFSVRRLSNDYSGPCIQVRRSDDNLTDIGFTAGGNLDTVALKIFAGGYDAYVQTWYDQSGNNNDLNALSNDRQPKIMSAGVIIRENNKPFIKFSTFPTGYNELRLNYGDMWQVAFVSAVFHFAPGGDGFLLGHSYDYYYWHSDGGNALFSTDNASGTILNSETWFNGAAELPEEIAWPTTLSLVEVKTPNSLGDVAWDNLGNDRTAYHFLTDGGYSELIVFPDWILETDRLAMETNQGTYFSIFGTLPVSWLSFTAEKQAKTVSLKWQTASEQDTKDFTIQTRTDGNEWKSIGSLPAATNSNTIMEYSFIHANPVPGKNYYRILETDIDGRKNYSITRAIQFTDKQPAFTLINNPVTNDNLQIHVYESAQVSLFTNDGRMIWQKHFDAGVQNIQLGPGAKGIYFLKSGNITERVLVN